MNRISPPQIIWEPKVDSFYSDCACPDRICRPITIFSPETVGQWQIAPSLLRIPLDGTHEAIFSPTADVACAVLNRSASQILDTFTDHQPIHNPIPQTLASLGLLKPVETAERCLPESSHLLTAWLHITNQCNLQCSYCYLKKTKESMDVTTGKMAVSAVVRSALQHGYSAIKLKYAGGEPTLHFDLVKLLHEYAKEQADHAVLILHETLLSNGVSLTPAMLDYIRDSGMRLAISLDGIDAAHDAQRIFGNGHGSFHLVKNGIERAIMRGVKPYLSITVSANSLDALSQVVEFALERELLFNLNFYRQHTPDVSQDILQAEDERLINGLLAAFKIIEKNLPSYSLVGTLIDRANFSSPHVRPCGAGKNYLVIDQHGKIARCQMEIEQSVSSIFVDDPLHDIRLSQQGFQNAPVEDKKSCRTCQWRYWCAGGCPLMAYRTNGSSTAKSPYCEVYKAVFPELLRLEGLRLLKWQASSTS